MDLSLPNTIGVYPGMTFQEALAWLTFRKLVVEVIHNPTHPDYLMGGVRKNDLGGIDLSESSFTVLEDNGEFSVTISYPGEAALSETMPDLDLACDYIYQDFRSRGKVPAVPTSGTWEGDAQALVDMGAVSVGVETVRGLLREMRQHCLALSGIEGRIEGRLHMNEVASHSHPDSLAQSQARLRAEAYTNALADVQAVVSDMREGKL